MKEQERVAKRKRVLDQKHAEQEMKKADDERKRAAAAQREAAQQEYIKSEAARKDAMMA